MAGLREWFSQTDERGAPPRIPVMVNMASSVSSKKNQKLQELSILPSPSRDNVNSASRNSALMDEYSDEDEEFQIAETDQEVSKLILRSTLNKFLSYCLFLNLLSSSGIF